MSEDAVRSQADLFEAALNLPNAEREAFVRGQCGHDIPKCDEVLSLLKHHEEAETFLTPHSHAAFQFLTDDIAADMNRALAIGTAVGRYSVRSVLGEGGMGVVYLAEQASPRREVALKIIRPGVASPELLKRFEYEAQMLGRLQHPGIAQIFEAGTATLADGTVRPFFAMELVHGVPLTQFAERGKLDTPARLRLFTLVCDAVHHAHIKGLIHRDLKPGNILVDSGGQPKILDFGIARASEAADQQTLHTSAGQIVGTIPYMSPEQAALDPGGIDTRSDVYALGVILHELLTGRMPYDVERRPIPEALEVIRSQEPSRLSSINRLYRGDIETIVGKALEKDRERRYQSAAEFADDIRRSLKDEPIIARPPSAFYQIGKFAKRNKALVCAVGGVFCALVVGLAATLRQAQLARDAAAGAQSINAFYQDILSTIDPVNAIGEPVTVKQLIDRGSSRIDTTFKGRPLLAASLHRTMAISYTVLAAYEDAEREARIALKLHMGTIGPDHRVTIDVQRALTIALVELRRYDEAREVAGPAYEAALRVLGPDDSVTDGLITELAIIADLTGRYEEAERFYRTTYETSVARNGLSSRMSVVAASNLAVFLMDRGKLNDAAELLERSLASSRRAFGEEHPQTLDVIANLGAVYEQQERFDLAEPLMNRAIEISRKIHGPEYPDTLLYLSNLGSLYYHRHEPDRAEALLVPLLERCEKSLGPTDIATMATLLLVAKVRTDQARYEEAESLAIKHYERTKRVFGPESPNLRASASLALKVYSSWGRADKVAEWTPLADNRAR